MRFNTQFGMPRRFLRRTWAIITLAVCFSVFASRTARPPAASRMVGTWSGYSDHKDFLRLELDKEGTGYLSFISVVRDAPVHVYRVKKWALTDWSIALELQPTTPVDEIMQFSRVLSRYEYIECDFGGSGWNRKATLFSESELRELGERAGKAITEQRKK